MKSENLKLEILKIISKPQKKLTILKNICRLLLEQVPHYDWVGFYFVNGDKKELKLGPYAGAETAHTTIPFGKGICGQVAESNRSFIVEDVRKESNYIACSLNVRSEIVIPIFCDGINIGQIDIDSNTVNAFGEEDENLLKFICTQVASIL